MEPENPVPIGAPVTYVEPTERPFAPPVTAIDRSLEHVRSVLPDLAHRFREVSRRLADEGRTEDLERLREEVLADLRQFERSVGPAMVRPGTGEGSQGRGERVLVVDDDDLVVLMMQTALESHGYRVTTAMSGQEALERIGEETPDLVLSDVNMPGMDGVALLERIRSDAATRWLPVLMLTTRAHVDDVVAGLALGADDYIVKPFAVPEVLARVRSKLERPPVPTDLLEVDRRTGLMTWDAFEAELDRERSRVALGGAPGVLAVLQLAELEGVGVRLGAGAADEALRSFDRTVESILHPLDLVGRLGPTQVAILLPDTTPQAAERRLQIASEAVARTSVRVLNEEVRATPSLGYVPLADGADTAQLVERAKVALDYATAHLDLQPMGWEPRMDAIVAQQRDEARRWRYGDVAGRMWDRVRTPLQVLATFGVGIGAPLLVYWWLDQLGNDITVPVYLMVVVALATTGALILVEGLLALRHDDPPEEPAEPYPTASAIIAAYLPNEAATIQQTIDAFLAIDYPGELQVILAYNTPEPMAVESTLRAIAEREASLTVFKVEGSTSKAQNVNAALSLTRGRFVGVFDADHQPEPGSFTRAWRWLSHGYDVVQGHCLVRNAEASFIARMVAVEFEAMYAVAHPGRARMHDWGIFGGSNGYWRTDLLHQVRMRGSMLTEDIDSSLRVIESGGRVKADPHLISRELATTTLQQVWNQRLRWAQGWFQVSLRHLARGMRSPHLTLRQKAGLVHLLGWREVYPWLSLQVFPIVLYWVLRGDVLDWTVPIFVMTTAFTLSVGPAQTWFAYRQAHPDIRRHRRWFLAYLLFASVFYTEYKNTVARVAHLKQVMGERDWRVTPRTADETD